MRWRLDSAAGHITRCAVSADETPDRNCECCASCCLWYDTWLRWQNRLHLLVTDPCFDVFITLCIILNTAFLALEHYGMSHEMRQTLEIGNRVSSRRGRLQSLASPPVGRSGLTQPLFDS